MFRKLAALVLLLTFGNPARAQETPIRTFHLAQGTLEILRLEPGSYALRLSNPKKDSHAGVSYWEVTGLHAMAEALDKAKEASRQLPVDEDKWVPLVVFEEPKLQPDASVAVAIANTETYGPLVALSFNLGREDQIDVASRAQSKDLDRVSETFLALTDDAQKGPRPDEVLIKGVYVQHSWRDGRTYISGADAKAYMNYAGGTSEPSVDLLIAAGECGYKSVWNGKSLDLRKSFEGNVYTATQESNPFTYSGSSYTGGSSTSSSGGPVYVRGYHRSDGTYVRSHTRSRPSR